MQGGAATPTRGDVKKAWPSLPWLRGRTKAQPLGGEVTPPPASPRAVTPPAIDAVDAVPESVALRGSARSRSGTPRNLAPRRHANEAKAQPSSDEASLRAECERLRREHAAMSAELQRANDAAGKELQRKLEEVEAARRAEEGSQLQAQNAQLARQMVELLKERAKEQSKSAAKIEALRAQNVQLKADLAQKDAQNREKDSQKDSQVPGDAELPVFGVSAEQRLRVAMTSNASRDELREAINGLDALLQEAKRELARKDLSEKRAALQELHDALESAKEDPLTGEQRLADALSRGAAAELLAEDMATAQAKLEALQNLTDEQRAAIAAKQVDAERKDRAFLLVKQNDVEKLKVLLDVVESETRAVGGHPRWRDWKRAGRSLFQAAQEPGREEVLAQLRGRLGYTPPVSAPTTPREPSPPITQAPRVVAPPVEAAPTIASEPPASTQEQSRVVGASDGQEPLSEAELLEMKTKATRAVVRNDALTLTEVLAMVPCSIWSTWRNKAGTDLLALSEERGSNKCYAVLAKGLGLVTEVELDPLEENETVWVFAAGDITPRRATVVRAPEGADDEVLLQFWDGKDEAQLTPRCTVRRSEAN